MHAPQSHKYIADRHALLSRRAVLDLKTQRDKLHQYQRRITVLTDRETEIAKQMLAKGDKKRALLALRRKKYQESLLAQTDGQLEQLEKLTANVEFAQIQKDVVFGLQQGTKVLKEIHAEMGGIEHVEKLMGETADAIAYQNVSVTADVRLTSFRGPRPSPSPFTPSNVTVPGANLWVQNHRRSARCLEARYRTRMRTRLRKSWRPWRPNWERGRRCPTSQTPNSPPTRLYQTHSLKG